MPRPQSGSSGPTLRKSQRPCGRLQNCLARQDSQKSYIPSQLYEIAKNGKKTGGFTHVLAYKSPTTPFFALKYLTRYTHETFFEEYTNFEAHYLSCCRDIPLQSFRSHILPQPHGLGLRLDISAISDGYEAIQGVQSHRSTCLLCNHSITGVFIGRVVPPPDY